LTTKEGITNDSQRVEDVKQSVSNILTAMDGGGIFFSLHTVYSRMFRRKTLPQYFMALKSTTLEAS